MFQLHIRQGFYSTDR